MIVRCPQCHAGLEIPDEKVRSDRRIACGACLRPFRLAEARADADPAAPAPTPTQVAQPAAQPAAVEAPRSPPPSPAPADWRHCARHPRTRSEHVCPTCGEGHCGACVDLVRTAAICRGCGGLCVDASRHAAQEEQQHRKRLPMMAEARAILGYPLTDTLTFVLMVLVVWVFSLARGSATGGGVALLLSQGLLVAYTFNALTRAANGNFRDFFPEIGGLGDLAGPLWASFAAFLSAGWPLIVAVALGWSSPVGPLAARTQPAESPAIVAVAHAQDEDTHAPYFEEYEADPEDGDGDGDGAGDEGDGLVAGEPAAARRDPPAPPPAPLHAGFWLMIIGVVWYVVYTPVALIVAAISRSAGPLSCLFQTLNPLVGISTILRMGSTYWQALGLYLALAIPTLLLGVALAHVPVAGGLVMAFVDGYASLAMGFVLGLAVYKKSTELGLQ